MPAPNYSIRATVVDLTGDTPQSTDTFWVDTNVWLWTTYTKLFTRPVRPPTSARVSPYVSFLKNAVVAASTIYRIGLTLSEMAHVIEGAEYEIAHPPRSSPPPPSKKEFRHNIPAVRLAVVREIQLAWQQVQTMSVPLPGGVLIDDALTTQTASALTQTAVDSYDLFALQALRAAGVTNIVSDDGDFCVVPGITLFTTNSGVLQAAHSQNKLVVR
jgi:hypothetical protein